MPDSSVSVVFNLGVGFFSLGQEIFSLYFKSSWAMGSTRPPSRLAPAGFLSANKAAGVMQLNAYFSFVPKLKLGDYVIRQFSNVPS